MSDKLALSDAIREAPNVRFFLVLYEWTARKNRIQASDFRVATADRLCRKVGICREFGGPRGGTEHNFRISIHNSWDEKSRNLWNWSTIYETALLPLPRFSGAKTDLAGNSGFRDPCHLAAIWFPKLRLNLAASPGK